MNGAEFANLVNTLPVLKLHFFGVYPIQPVLGLVPPDHFILMNTETRDSDGRHWFVVVHDGLLTWEIFDSLGVADTNLLLSRLNLCNSIVSINTQQFQEGDTDTCGKFCLYFILHRIVYLDIPFFTLLSKIFFTNFAANEQEVQLLISHL